MPALTPAEISAIDAAARVAPVQHHRRRGVAAGGRGGCAGRLADRRARRSAGRGARRDGVVVDRDPRPRASRCSTGDRRPAGDDEPRDVRRPDPRARGPAGAVARRGHARRAWTRCSSRTPGRCRSRWPPRWRCSTGAASARPAKHRLMTWRGGYHGDTFTPMSVCDPDGGMHSLWTDVLTRQVFAPQVPSELRPRLHRGVRAPAGRPRRRTGRGDRRARGPGCGRDAVPRSALPGRPAGHLRPARRAADLRRDRDRLRPHRRAVRRRPRGRAPGRDVRRQGAHRRLHHPGRHAVHRARSRTPSARGSPAR